MKKINAMSISTEEYLKVAGEVLNKIKPLAKEYYSRTGRPLGVTGEIAEYEAIRLLNLKVAEVRQSGFDAIRKNKSGVEEKIQIKGRVLNNTNKGQKLGSIKPKKVWDIVILVILDSDFNPIEMFEAGRSVIEEALNEPGSKARNERGQLNVSSFKSMSALIWKS
jgi:hypothetical protein